MPDERTDFHEYVRTYNMVIFKQRRFQQWFQRDMFYAHGEKKGRRRYILFFPQALYFGSDDAPQVECLLDRHARIKRVQVVWLRTIGSA